MRRWLNVTIRQPTFTGGQTHLNPILGQRLGKMVLAEKFRCILTCQHISPLHVVLANRSSGVGHVGTTQFSVGLLGMYSDIQERDELEIDGVRYNIKSVGLQRLTQRTRLRVVRKP